MHYDVIPDDRIGATWHLSRADGMLSHHFETGIVPWFPDSRICRCGCVAHYWHMRIIAPFDAGPG